MKTNLLPHVALLTGSLLMLGCHSKAEDPQSKPEPAQPPAPSADAAPAPSTLVVANDATTAAPAPAAAATGPVVPPPVDPGVQTAARKLEWPRTYKDGTTTLLVYQPEIEKWDGYNFTARFAVSIQEASAPAPTFGVVWVKATSSVDKDEGVVTISNISITKTNFPTEPNNAKQYVDFLNAQIPAHSVPIPLAQIDNQFLLGQALKKVATQPVKNAPPRIIYSDQPALLLLVSGAPVMRPLAGTNCNRVLNTNYLIVQNAADGGPYFLSALGYWYRADNIEGPWTYDPDAANPPSSLPQVYQAAAATNQIDLIPPQQGKTAPPPPDIYVSTEPAELIQSNGQPEFVPIHGTQLLEVKNSDNAIILNIGNQLFYVLISGRWFSSSALTGQPWTFVSGDKLPADFAKIPPNSDKGSVLVSVPGTPQAQEAVIANSIPQTATVNRNDAKLTVAYEGSGPQFAPVTGTTLQYAVNTPTPVIEVNPTSFYACMNGIWFTSNAAAGPWVVATSVPTVIYTIPVSSPIHYVTYVQVYGYTDSVVYVGYTPGYYGTVVVPGGTVVYGSGYVYPAYIGTTTYVAPPPTYGYGAGFTDGAASGFLFGFAAGVALDACLAPNWGCWGGNTYNVTVNNGNIYNHWGGTVVTTHPYYGYHGGGYVAAGYNPYNGNWAAARNGAYYNPNTGTYASGHSEAYGNAYTGNYAASQSGSAYNSRTGTSADGSRSVSGNAYNGNWNAARSGEVGNPNTGRSASGTTSASGNAYNGNWQANQQRNYYNSQTGTSASSTKQASGNAYNGTYNEQTDRSATTANGSSYNGQKTTTDGTTTHQGSYYNANTGNSQSWDHTSGQGASGTSGSTSDRMYSDSNGNVYRPSSSSSSGYQQATSSGWKDASQSQAQDLNRQSQGWGDGSRWGGSQGSGGGDRWGGGNSGGGRWGGGGDRWGGGGGGFGGGGGGRSFGGGGGGRSWR